MDKQTYDKILRILHQEVKPALGCTEPIAVAIAVAEAVSLYPGGSLEKITVRVSPNILKNAMGVGIPGTGKTGLPMAIALAACCGNADYGLEVLKDVNERSVKEAEGLLDIVNVELSSSDKLLFIEAECRFKGGHKSVCTVEDAHDNISYAALDGKAVIDRRNGAAAGGSDEISGEFLTFSMIYEFGKTAALEDLSLMKEEIAMNSALAEEGLKGSYGLLVGKTIASGTHRSVYGDTVVKEAMALTAAASDARMSGCPLPAMSNSGSGNQGLTASMPVIAVAKHLGSSEEELIRALAVSNLVAIHIKSYLGKLSALCGCVVASTGSSCGIIMLSHGTVEQMAAATKNMIGNITGMVCDGAKKGCALKVASGVSSAIQSAVLALDGICIQPTDGIIDSDIENTIRNLGRIGSVAMKETDRMILRIMTDKTGK